MGMVLSALAFAPPANASAAATSGCNVATVPGGQISTYPAWPGTQSSMLLACVFEHNTTNDDTTAKFTIHDFKNAQWHNGAARSVTNTASIASGATTFTATNCAGATGFINRGITTVGGVAGIAARTFVTSISGACLVTLNKPTNAVIAAGTTFKIDSTSPRSVGDASTTSGSPTITSATANFTAADNGFSVTGTNIPPNTTMTFVNATTATLSQNADGTGVNQALSFGGTLVSASHRTFNDGQYTSTTTISSTAAKFKAEDVGMLVTGSGIGAACYVASRTATVLTLDHACVTVNALLTNVVTIGEASATAPTQGETVMDQGTQLDLNPTLVAGSRPCADEEVEGFHVTATWNNPGQFIGGAFATMPAGTKAVGQLQVKTSVITYGAYIIETPSTGDAGGLPIGVQHYDVVFPNVPTGLALCAATATSPKLGYVISIVATTPSVAALGTGVGRPGTAQLRATQDANVVTTLNVSAFLTSEDPLHPLYENSTTGTQFSRLCQIPPGAPTVNFQCGV
jgi:hypothetical protein